MRDSNSEESRDSPLSSMFGEVTVFRDFFLAAFSDGYSRVCKWTKARLVFWLLVFSWFLTFVLLNHYFFPTQVACCAEEGFFPGSEDACISRELSHEENIQRTGSLVGSHSPSIKKSSSAEGRKRRKKPLAVAVGFNYANDADGRPIVITPGGRRLSPRSVGDSLMYSQSPSHLSNGGRSKSGEDFAAPRMPTLSRNDESGTFSLSYKEQNYLKLSLR